MRAILIDPTNRTVTEVDLADGLDPLYAMIGCDTVQHIVLSNGVDLWLDDEGMLTIEYEDEDNCASDFFVLKAVSGKPANLIVGKAVVRGFDSGGDTTALPNWCGVEAIKLAVSFVPDDKRNEAAKLCDELVGQTCMVTTEEEMEALQAQYAGIMHKAGLIATMPAIEQHEPAKPAKTGIAA